MEYIDGVSANDVEGIKKLGFEPIQARGDLVYIVSVFRTNIGADSEYS